MIFSKHGIILLGMCALSSLSYVFSTKTGVAMLVDVGVLDQVKNYFLPTMMSTLNSLDLGKIEFDGGWVDNLQFNLNIKSQESLDLTLSGKDDAIVAKLNDITGNIKGNFLYKMLFIQTKGGFNVRLDPGVIKTSVKVPLIMQDINGRHVPGVEMKDMKFVVDSSKIHIDLSGSIVADVADAFVALFKSLIMGKITDIIKVKVPAIASAKVNSKIATTNGFIGVIDPMKADFTFTEIPQITD